MGYPGAPNQSKPGDHENSTAPLGAAKGAVHGPNQTDPGDRRGGTMPLAGGPPAIQPPNKSFAVGHSSMPSGS